MSLLSVRDLTVKFAMRDHSVTALDQISFDLTKGERLGIVGESGAGKSTLATMLAQRGLAHFTDDVGVVDPNTNPLNVLPMPKGVKLEQDIGYLR